MSLGLSTQLGGQFASPASGGGGGGGGSPIEGTPTYSGTSFSVAAKAGYAEGCCEGDGSFWITDSITQAVHKYTLAGVYDGLTFNVGAQSNNPRGITYHEEHLWVLGFSQLTVYKYTTAGVYTGTSFSVSSETGNPSDICSDGTNLWVLTKSTAVHPYSMLKYTTAGAYVSKFSVLSPVEGEGTMEACTWDTENFWIGGDQTNYVYKFSAAGVYQSLRFSVNSQEPSIGGIAYDPTTTSLWVVGSTNDTMFKYT